MIDNPSNHPLIVQLVFSHSYPRFPHLLSSLPFFQSPMQMDYKDDDSFFIHNVSLNNHTTSLSSMHTILGHHTHPNSSTLLLQPNQKLLVQLMFKPPDTSDRHSYLVIRNNLTIVEVVSLRGRGSLTDIRLSGRKSGSSKPLLFQMSDKQLRSCNSQWWRCVLVIWDY